MPKKTLKCKARSNIILFFKKNVVNKAVKLAKIV